MKVLVPFFLSLSLCAAIVTGANYASAKDGPPILIAQADGSGSAVAALPGAGSASAPAANSPADKLHDPVAQPGASWDDLKAAKKVGWAAAVFAVLVLLCKLLGRLKGKLSVLGKGKVPVVLGAVGAIAASCYNAALDGGAWTATMVAGMMALAHFVDAGGKEGS